MSVAVLILANTFVYRQTEDSPFSYYEGEWNELVDLVEHSYLNGDYEQGYRDGVILVNVEPSGFFSGIVTLTEGDELTGSFKPRRRGETPRKQVLAKGGKKIPAQSCQIVLYRGDVLAEGGDNDGNGTADQWEIISINASPVEGSAPIDPMTLLHNHFGSDGGTDTNMSDSELVKQLSISMEWWRDKAMAG
jgi:hypothetical protein